MNKRGNVFGVAIVLVLALFLVWSWSLMSGDVAAITESTIVETSGTTHAGALEFVLRSFVWLVPLIVVVGMLFWGFSR